MTIANQKPADLDAKSLNALNALEKELGATLVAYEAPKVAELTEEQLARLQQLEKKLGSTVIAYRN